MIVNSRTSFVPIETQNLTGGQTIIVYLSSTSEIGQLVTIRDIHGYLSSPQSIVVSTVDAQFTGGTTTITLQQRYAYVSLRSVSNTEWAVIDQAAFLEPSTFSVRGIATQALQATHATFSGLSINEIKGVSLTLQSTLEGTAPLYVSTLTVGGGASTVAFQTGGPFFNTGNLQIQGNLFTFGGAALVSTIVTSGALSTGSVTIQGPVIHSTSGLARIQGGLSTGYVTTFQGPLSTGGLVQLVGNSRIIGTLQTSSIQTNQLTATTLTASNLQLSTNAFHRVRPDLTMTAPGYTGITNPVVQIEQGTAGTTAVLDWINADRLTTGTLAIQTSISSPSLLNATFAAAAIQNPAGSLVISSIQTGALSYQSMYGPLGVQQLQRVNASTIATSTMGIQYEVIAAQIQAPVTRAETVSSVQTTTSSLNLGGIELQANALTLSSIFISSGVFLDNLSSITIPNATFNNTGGNYTGGTVVASTATLSSISQLYQILGTTLSLSTPQVTLSTAGATVISSYTITTSSVNGSWLQIGNPLQYSTISPGGLYLVPSTISGLTSNTPYEYVSGLGVVYNPIVVKASMDRTINMYPGNISSYSTSYINAQMTYRSDGSTTSGVAGFRVGNTTAYSTLAIFNANPALPFQTFQLSNYPVDRNFGTVGITYRLTGPSTSYPISTISAQVIVGAGNVLAYSFDSGATWATTDSAIFDTTATAAAWNGTMWVATGIGSVNSLAYSYDGITWYGSGKAIFTFYANTVAWNGILWVAGGAGTNTLAYSYDGITWTGLGSALIGIETNSIAWNGYMFVAVARDDNTIAYSYDGILWSGLGSTVFTYGHGVAWGNDMWVAVGEGTTLAYSYTGLSWTAVPSIFTVKGSCVAWNGSLWVAGGQGTYQAAYSSDGITWTGVTIASVTNAIGIAWSGTRWILLGSNGAILTSTDGSTWTATTTPFSSGRGLASRTVPSVSGIFYTGTSTTPIIYSPGGKRWYSITSLISGTINSIVWNGRVWLAGMSAGNDTIARSTDGIVWIGLGKTIFSGNCNAIAWNGYVWVAVGNGINSLAYSYDGISWTGLGTSIFGAVGGYGVAWGKDKFVALGYYVGVTANWSAYSYDGVNWTVVSQSFAIAGSTTKPTYNGTNQWIAFGSASGKYQMYSSDGLIWTLAATQISFTQPYSAAWGDNKWVILGTTGIATPRMAYSYDGNTWTLGQAGISGRGVTWTGSKWYITGAGNANPIVYTSLDGITWISESPDRNGPGYALFYKQSIPYEQLTIACASSASALMAISPDGRYWNPITAPFTQQARCVVWNGIQWVAGGSGTYQVAYSSNGVNWTGVAVANMTSVFALAWGASADGTVQKWIGVGEGTNTRAESTDGITWTSYAPTPSTFFTAGGYGIIAAKGWIAVGGNNMGGLATTTNGTTWTAASPAVFTSGRAIAWNGRDFVAVGQGTTTLAFSTDAVSWLQLSVFTVQGNGVAYGAGVWVAVGEGTNTIAFSTNGYEWTGLGATVFSTKGTGISWNGAYFTGVGEGTNTLAYSDDGIHWTAQSTTFTTATYLGNPGRANGVGSRSCKAPPLTIREGQTFTWVSAGWAAAVAPSIIMKSPSASLAWDSRVNSVESLTDSVYLLFSPTSTTGAFMMGVSQAPTTTTSYTQINYAISCDATGGLSIYESGAFVNGYGTYQVGDTFKITFDTGVIRYYKNTTLLRAISRASVLPLYVSCSLRAPGTKIVGIEFHSIYRIVTSTITTSTSSYVAATTPGFAQPLSAPFYLNLTGELAPTLWGIGLTASASSTITNYSTTLSADIYINDTKYYSTNVISTYLSSPQTFQFYFSVPTTIAYVPNTALNVRFKSDRTAGDIYTYVNWVNSNATQGYSTVMNTIQANPNAMEFLQFFHTSFNTGLQTSELATWLSPVSTNTTSYFDSNYSINMNSSYIKWNTALNAVTVQNRFNDTQTRSLTYTGALYNASDSNLKHSIEYVEPQTLATAFEAIPLRRFRFSDAYCSTFQTEDRTQLGVLTSEVPTGFVTETPFEYCGLSTLNTVDRTQLRYLHLAATQALIGRVSTLKGLITT